MAYEPPAPAFAPYYGAFAYFAPEGRTIESTEVDKDNLPPGSSFETWESLSCIEEASLATETEGGEQRYCFNPSTGKYDRRETIGQDTTLVYEMSVQEVTEYILQLAHNVAEIDANGGGVPNSQPQGIHRGWLKIQQQNGTEVVTVAEIWGELALSNAIQIAGRSSSVPQLRFTVVDNALNAVAFGTETP